MKIPITSSLGRAIFVVAFCSAPCMSGAQPANMQYSCIGDMVGGLNFDKASKKWEATTFPIIERFNLKLKLLSATAKKNLFNRDDIETKYEVEVETVASKDASPCVDYGKSERPFSREVGVTQFSYLRCYWGGLTHARQLTFNLKNFRFIEVYLHGYLDEKDDGKDDQPALIGGTCKKIE